MLQTVPGQHVFPSHHGMAASVLVKHMRPVHPDTRCVCQHFRIQLLSGYPQVSQRVQVENTGDVGTKYSLDMAALAPHFTAFPGSGFLAPNQQAQVEITFHPKALNPDIRVDRVRLPLIYSIC